MNIEELLGQYLYGMIAIPGRILTMDEAERYIFVLQLYGFKAQVVYAFPPRSPILAGLMVAIAPGELDRMYNACATHGFSFVQVNQKMVEINIGDTQDAEAETNQGSSG